MKQTAFLLLLLFSFSLTAQDQFSQNVITKDLVQFMSQSSDDDLIPINIVLTEKYPTAQLFSQVTQLKSDERRMFVINELKSFSEQSQYNLRNYISMKELSKEVEQGHNFWITNVISCKATKGVIHELSLRDDIDRIDHDEVRFMLIGDQTALPAQPGMPLGVQEITSNVIKVNAPAVWDLGYTGQGVVVAVLDVGVNYNHADLEDHMWTSVEYPNHGYDFAYNDNDPMDYHGHGTHCAGTVAGDGTAGSETGMAPDALIMAVKVLDDSGGGQESNSWEGFEFAVDNGADVISFSVGWAHSWNPDRVTWRNTLDNTLAAGVVASIAAGNEGGNPNNPDDVRTPGDCPPPWLNPDQTLLGGISACVCVGATDNNDNIATFSSRGPSSWESISPYNDYPYNPEMGLLRPDVSAPGVSIKSCDAFNINGYTTMSGTSMATPGVAGVMALLLSKVPGLTPLAIDQALETTAVDLGASGKDNLFGAGRVDAYEAFINLIEVYAPTNLQVNTIQETGLSSLSWNHNTGMGFQYYKIYRNNEEINTSINLTYEDQLTDYGYYTYKVTAFYGGTLESDPAVDQTQWGSSEMVLTPDTLISIVQPEGTDQQTLMIKNTGVLDLTFFLSPLLHAPVAEDWYTIEPENGSIPVGDSLIITITFSAEFYTAGIYTDLPGFVTNELNSSIHYFSLTMIVNDLEVNAFANPTDVCMGGSTHLGTNISGGSGSFTYAWTSVPEGFSSTEAEPEVFPTENTEYFVSVFDGFVNIEASVLVAVHDIPEIALGEDQVLCGEMEYPLDAANSGSTYEWSTGETTQTIMATGSGENSFWVKVINENGCEQSDTINITFAEYPVVELGADTTICDDATLVLDAANPGSSYEWSTGETTQIIDVIESGSFWVNVTNQNGCEKSDTVNINFAENPVVDLGADTTICDDAILVLDAGYTGADYLWSTNETTKTITINAEDYTQGSYDFSVEVTNEYNCISMDEVIVEILDCTGIDENYELITVSVYPNPNKGIFMLELQSHDSKNVTLKVVSVSGAIVYEESGIDLNDTYRKQLDLSQLEDGIYNIFVIDNNIVISKKVVVSK